MFVLVCGFRPVKGEGGEGVPMLEVVLIIIVLIMMMMTMILMRNTLEMMIIN